MSIALPAILIFILPGIFFNQALFDDKDPPLNFTSLTGKMLTCLTIAFFVHLISIILIHYLFRCTIDVDEILALASGAQYQQHTTETMAFYQILQIAVYLFLICISGFLLGLGSRKCIKKFKLDKKKALRPGNPWYYLFTGYDWPHGKPDGIIIGSMVELDNKAYLYFGYLEDYFLDSKGNIDRFVLTKAKRRSIVADKKPSDEDSDKRFYPIDGNYFF